MRTRSAWMEPKKSVGMAEGANDAGRALDAGHSSADEGVELHPGEEPLRGVLGSEENVVIARMPSIALHGVQQIVECGKSHSVPTDEFPGRREKLFDEALLRQGRVRKHIGVERRFTLIAGVSGFLALPRSCGAVTGATSSRPSSPK